MSWRSLSLYLTSTLWYICENICIVNIQYSTFLSYFIFSIQHFAKFIYYVMDKRIKIRLKYDFSLRVTFIFLIICKFSILLLYLFIATVFKCILICLSVHMNNFCLYPFHSFCVVVIIFQEPSYLFISIVLFYW